MKKTKIISIVLLVVVAIIVAFLLVKVIPGERVIAPQTSEVVDNSENSENQDPEEQDQEEQNSEQDLDPLPIELSEKSITIDDGTEFNFQLAEPFDLAVSAEGLGKARFMTYSPDGRIFVPDLVDYQLSREGKVYILDEFNEETKKFEKVDTYLDNLRGPNSLDFYTDEDGNQWLYLALTEHLVRYPYNAGDTEPSGEPEVILEFPNTQAPEAKSVVWHITRTVKIQNDKVYVSIGSGCNSCEQPEGEMYGMIATLNPDGSDVEYYADGLRNSVDFTWDDQGQIYATENGADHLGSDRPDELVYKIDKGEDYAWPYCYETDGEVVLDDTTAWNDPIDCDTAPRSFASFEARSAPLGIDFFDEVHPVLRNSFLVALHGSFDPNLMKGYEIVRLTKDGEQSTFMSGFQDEDGERYARPLDFLQYDENSFFFTDDYGGKIYFVYTE